MCNKRNIFFIYINIIYTYRNFLRLAILDFVTNRLNAMTNSGLQRYKTISIFVTL